MIGKLLTLKAAAAAGVILIGATGAAAATGSLPNAVQGVAHSTLAHVGVDVPDDDSADQSDDPANADHQADDPSTTDTTVPGATPAVEGDNGATGTDAATDDHGDDPTDTPDSATADDSSGDTQSGDGHDGGTVTVPPTDPSTDSGSGQGSATGSDGTGSNSGPGGSGSSGD